jgi:probable sporulation protein (polysaccharide deacetylase family)
MKNPSPFKVAAMLGALTAVLAAGTFGPLEPFIQSVKTRAQAEMAFGAEQADPKTEELMRWIASEAASRRIAPIDAYVDPVWKAIPGYNGREVDLAATLKQAKALGMTEVRDPANFPWVYREIPPKKNLDAFPLEPTYKGNPQKPMVALMINVAWGDEYLEPMLETLAKEKVKATFFLDGSWLSKHPDTAKEILRQGHELSNHAYSHPMMSRLSLARQRQEIERTERLLAELGVRNRWFAPPSGDYNAATVKAASEYGLRTVLWTLDTIDWKNPPAWSIVTKVSTRVKPGTLILMHPTASTRDALAGIIRAIRKQGYEPGTVADTLSPERVD